MSQPTIYSIDNFQLKDQNVFIRTDFNVPLENGKVQDHIRLLSAISTIEHALKNQARVIIGSHRGRPEQANKKHFSLEPFGYYLGEKLNCEVVFIEDIRSQLPTVLLSSLNSEKIILLENLRFHPGEKKGDHSWATQLASCIDIYINEAFSVSHRNHMSISILPLKIKKRGQGFSMKKERQILDHILHKASPPLVLIVGGVKIDDKIKTLSRLVDQLDILLIGGTMAYAFLKAKGKHINFSIHDSLVKEASNLITRLEARGKQILLPVDHWLSDKKSKPVRRILSEGSDVPMGFYPMDIGPQTVKIFSKAIKTAHTIFWNGPMGYFEENLFADGTMKMCEIISNCKTAFRVVGGGDSITAVLQSGKSGSFDYISTGGGAALKYLQTGTLPGIESLAIHK